MWSFTILVRPKRSAPAAFRFASPSSVALECGTGPARKGSRAAQRGCNGEDSSTHAVTSRGDGRVAVKCGPLVSEDSSARLTNDVP